MGKVSLILKKALARIRAASSALTHYGISTTTSESVLLQVSAKFGAVEVASARIIIPYFEGAAAELGLGREVGVHVNNALYFLFVI